jgi:exonuclease III
MTSLLLLRPLIRSFRLATTTSTAICRSYVFMSRDISPPPAKRRKIAAQTSTPISKQPPSDSEPLPPLGHNSVRIFSWNINGINPFLQKSITSFFPTPKSQDNKVEIPPPSLRGFLHRHKWPSILFLQEVKISSTDTKTQDAVKAAINSKLPPDSDSTEEGPKYETYFTLPTDPYNARGPRGSGKVYGVCTILRADLCNDYKAKVRTVNWDQEGRISVVELTTDTTRLAILNIYAVNGTENAYRDSKTGAVRGTRHDRKRQVHGLLMQECRELEEKGWDVLVAGDMNIAPDSRDGYPKLRTFPAQHNINRADFHARLLGDGSKDKSNGLNGVDVWRKMHGDDRRYTYFSRGREWGSSCDRVDFVVAGRGMWNRGMIKASGIMDSEAERGPSDHCPIWVDVGIESDDVTKKEHGTRT